MSSFTRIESSKKDILNSIPRKMNLMINRESTAASFFKTIRLIKVTFASSNECWDMLCMQGVGLKCDGRNSCYDLMWFSSTNKIYAVDSSDDTYVCEINQ